MAAARFEDWLGTLEPGRQLALALAYADAARRAGAYVVTADGSAVDIPPILTPVSLPRARMAVVSASAHAITAGLVRLTDWLMSDDSQAPLRARLFGSFTPLESEAMRGAWPAARNLATVRVDFLVDAEGRARALEVNATIPAMQGYSDAMAEAFIRVVGGARGLSGARIGQLVDDNGRNTDNLLASLGGHFRRLGGAERPMRIVVVAREGDAQRGELEHYVRRWTALGHQAFIVAPAEVRLVGGAALVDDVQPDVLYRHIFARRLDPASDFARMCLEAERFHVLNPIASHLEVKGMLALLSAAAGDDAAAARIGLSEDERAAVERDVPWTRLLSDNLVPRIREQQAGLVLKRSWDYGGRSVFLGSEMDSPASQARMRAVTGREGSWAELLEFALTDREAWVVQALVPTPSVTLGRVEPDGVRPRILYANLSAFTNSGLAARPTGGAVRASESRIVNILGGGGLAPLLREDVLTALLG